MGRAIVLLSLILSATGIHASESEDCARRLHENAELALMRDVKLHVIKAWDNTRFAKNFTQKDLARLFGVSQGAVSQMLNNMERAAWTNERLTKLAAFLEVPLEDLIPPRLAQQLNPSLVPTLEPDELRANTASETKLIVYYLSKGIFVEREDISELASVVDSAAKAAGRPVDDRLIESTVLRMALTRATAER